MLIVKMEYKVRNFRFPLFAGSRLISGLHVSKSAIYESMLLILLLLLKRGKLIFGISLTKSQKKCQIHRTG